MAFLKKFASNRLALNQLKVAVVSVYRHSHSKQFARQVNNLRKVGTLQKIYRLDQASFLSTSVHESQSNEFVEIFDNADDAIKDIKSEAKLLVGGFGKKNNQHHSNFSLRL